MPLPFARSAESQPIDLAFKIRTFLNAPQRGLNVMATASRVADMDVFNT
jgi:hypothetical protein